jgi:23S rRNA pseudouridine2605 synthase
MGDNKIHKTPIRLQVFLAKAGFGSRRKCEEYIREGRVKVDGDVVTKLGTKVTPQETITLDGKHVRGTENLKYFALNKPRGYICSSFDPQGRPLAIDLLKPTVTERIYNIGRLDLNSSGLIILTNDGYFAEKISHPKGGIKKVYVVETKNPIPNKLLDDYKSGVEIEGIDYTLVNYHLKTHRKVQLILIEGKNREIRRIFEYFNCPVSKIHRIRIGPVSVKGIPTGSFRPLTRKEIEILKNKSKGDL